MHGPCRLDEWVAHIWYLQRRCGCREGGRVARLGDCITPLEFTYDRSLTYEQRVEANIGALRAALALIAEAMPAGAADQESQVAQCDRGGSDDHAP